MKQRIVAAILLLSLIVPVGATVLFLRHQRTRIRKEVKHRIMAGLDREDLVLLRFSSGELSELKWKHSREFEYRGFMYDIVERETRGDTTSFWCWLDRAETALNQQLHELYEIAFNQNPENRKSQQRLFSFFRSLFLEQNNPEAPLVEALSTANFAYNHNYGGFITQPPVPPPRLI